MIPPIGVLFTVGFGLQFILNVVLTLFGYIPGLIHAIWVVTRAELLRPGQHEQPREAQASRGCSYVWLRGQDLNL